MIQSRMAVVDGDRTTGKRLEYGKHSGYIARDSPLKYIAKATGINKDMSRECSGGGAGQE